MIRKRLAGRLEAEKHKTVATSPACALAIGLWSNATHRKTIMTNIPIRNVQI
jgi:hypothetical protein